MIKVNFKNREELLLKVEQWTEIPMLVLVVIMVITLIIPLVIPLDEPTHNLLELIDWVIWGTFFLELLVKTYLSPKKLVYLRKNWVDVIVVALPLLRVFRVFRVARGARALRLLRFGRILALFGKFMTEVKTILSRHGFHYLFIIFIALIVIGTFLSYSFDQNLNSGANSLTAGLWLAVVNAISGGFANVYPESPESKAISIVLILVGTVIVSYFTASLASYFTEKTQDIEQARIEKKLDNLIEKVDKLESKITKKT